MVLVLAGLLLPAAGCYDESDACRDYCDRAAGCLSCGATTESLKRCQDECVALSIPQQRDLANCAKDCANFAACGSIVDTTPPNPCSY